MRHRRNRAADAGFTLVELMVVVIILGILVGVAAVKLNPWKKTEEARMARAKTDLSTLDSTVKLFIAQHSRLPNGLEEVAPELDGGALPDDPWGRPYQFRILDAHTRKYEIVSLGADGEPGGEEANADISTRDLLRRSGEGGGR